MTRCTPRALVFGLALAVGSLVFAHTSRAEMVHFIVQDMEDESATWLPVEVVIHRDQDLERGLVFVLDNPTARTHVFEAPGLFEQVAEKQGEVIVKPLRVTVAPEDTIQVRVNLAPLERMPEPCVEEAHYQFFCPLHQADSVRAGTIRVVP
ncbi:MAG: hypothetical protein HY581_05790 [Nitrospirae bacterium]|nr:hypothetical protein [Nitrospirota bacterium]